MKKLIVLILILIITPFFVVSNEPITEKVTKIEEANSKNPKTANWEYVKARAFDKNEVLVKGYNKPVLITLENSSLKDSLIVVDIIKKIKNIVPSIKIGFEFDEKTKTPFHYVNLSFGKNPSLFKEHTETRDGLFRAMIYRNKEKFTFASGKNSYTGLYFDFEKDIEDKHRKLYLRQELLRAVFSTKSTNKKYDDQFPSGIFNFRPWLFINPVYLEESDKFLLKKVYAEDFEDQLEDYLYTYYPWRYAYSFLSKEKMKFLATSFISILGVLVFLLLFSFFQNRKFRYTYLNYLFPILLVLFQGLNLSWIYIYLTDFSGGFIDWEKNIKFGWTVCVLLGVVVSVVLYFGEKMIIKLIKNFSFQLVSKTSLTFLAFNTPYFVVAIIYSSLSGFSDFYHPWFLISIFLSVGRGLLIYLNHFSDSLVKEKDVELSRLQEAYAQSELKSLQSQINPHFLYNALNSIASLAHTNADKTEKMALSLSDLFKYTINRKDKKISTVNEELEMVRSYLEIEQTRFGDRLEFVIDVEDEVLQEEIPMFLLQPLVENAVKHGVSKIEDKGVIKLNIIKTDKNLEIEVTDNGPDFPEGLVSGHGLQTVYDLLRLSYGDKAALKWQNTPQKSICILIDKTA